MSVREIRCEVTFPASHPAFPGHFPGQPVVPGVLLLAHVAGVLAAADPPFRVTGVRQSKFLSPLAPDTPCVIAMRWRDAARVDFECTAGGARVVARGTLECAPA